MIPLYDDNPAHRRPLVTVVLIGTCCLVFLWQVSLDPRAQQAAAYSFGFVPAVVLGERSLPVELAVVADAPGDVLAVSALGPGLSARVRAGSVMPGQADAVVPVGDTDADETRGGYRVAGPDQFGGFGRSEHFAFHGCLPPGLLCLRKR